MVDRFDITAADILKNERANLELVATLEEAGLDVVVVDAAAVGAVLVFKHKAAWGPFDFSVETRHALIGKDDVVAEVTTDGCGLGVERVAPCVLLVATIKYLHHILAQDKVAEGEKHHQRTCSADETPEHEQQVQPITIAIVTLQS